MVDRDFKRNDGKWFPVMNELAEKLMTYQMSGAEHRVLWLLFRKCYGWQNSTCDLRWSEIIEATGLEKGTLSKAISKLKERNILKSFQKETKTHVTYKINSKLSTWKDGVSKRKQFPKSNKTVSKKQQNSFQKETTPIKDTSKDNKDKQQKIVFPVWLDKEIWKEYKTYRRNGKGKFTTYAQKLAIKKLTQLKQDGNDPNEVIKQSILNGWSGLFPIKHKNLTDRAVQEWLENA